MLHWSRMYTFNAANIDYTTAAAVSFSFFDVSVSIGQFSQISVLNGLFFWILQPYIGQFSLVKNDEQSHSGNNFRLLYSSFQDWE